MFPPSKTPAITLPATPMDHQATVAIGNSTPTSSTGVLLSFGSTSVTANSRVTVSGKSPDETSVPVSKLVIYVIAAAALVLLIVVVIVASGCVRYMWKKNRKRKRMIHTQDSRKSGKGLVLCSRHVFY